MSIQHLRITVAASLAVAALALAACGDGDGEPAAASSGGTTGTADAEARRGEAMLEFARCMRENGVDMPDPDPSGPLMIRPPEGTPRDTMRKAMELCRPKLQASVDQSPEARQKRAEAMLKLTQCLREQGIDVPDPSADGGMRFTPEDGVDPADPAFRQAMEHCRDEVRMP